MRSVQIVFQDAMALQAELEERHHHRNDGPWEDRSPAALRPSPLSAVRTAPRPQRLHYAVKIHPWGSTLDGRGPRELQIRPVVHSVATRAPSESKFTIARTTLAVHDIIGVHGGQGRMLGGQGHMDCGQRAEVRVVDSPRAVASGAVLPTLVIHVPSNLNRGVLDASVALPPNTLSWLYRPKESRCRPRDAEQPIVVVPLYLHSGQRDVPFRTTTAGMGAYRGWPTVRYRWCDGSAYSGGTSAREAAGGSVPHPSGRPPRRPHSHSARTAGTPSSCTVGGAAWGAEKLRQAGAPPPHAPPSAYPLCYVRPRAHRAPPHSYRGS